MDWDHYSLPGAMPTNYWADIVAWFRQAWSHYIKHTRP